MCVPMWAWFSCSFPRYKNSGCCECVRGQREVNINCLVNIRTILNSYCSNVLFVSTEQRAEVFTFSSIRSIGEVS